MKTFGELSREDQLALFEAWLDGKTIEFKSFLSGDGFMVNHHPSWDSRGCYRVALTKPSINWDHVHPMYRFMATDKSGHTYLYTHEAVPWLGGEAFCTVAGTNCAATTFTSFKEGTCDWKDSLVKRLS